MANPPECLLRCVNSGAGALRALSHVMLSAWVQKLVALKFESTCLLINPLSTLVSLEELKVCNLKDRSPFGRYVMRKKLPATGVF